MLSKHLFALTAAFCLCSASIAQADLSECAAQLHPLEQQVQQHALTKASVEKDLKKTETDILELEKNLGWREKYLAAGIGKFFGGNANLIDRHGNLHKTRLNLEAQLETAKLHLGNADKAVADAAIKWLRANDAAFDLLNQEAEHVCAVAYAGNTCLQHVDNAISAVSSAETEDLIGGMTDNKFVESMAISDTRAANVTVQNAKIAVESYIRSLNELKSAATENHNVTGAGHISETDTSTQFIMDFGFNSDFMDIMNYFNLSNTESQLRTVRGKVAAAHAKVDAAQRELTKKIDQRVCELRESCRGIPASQP